MSEPESGLILEQADVLDASGKAVLSNLSLLLMPGQIAAVLGPNGSGKTIFLMACCGVLQMKGKALLKGFDLTQSSGRQGLRGRAVMVPENLGDFFLTTTVQQELELTARLQSWDKHQITSKVKEVWERSGIKGEITRTLAGLNRGESLRLILIILKMMVPWLIAWDGSQRQLDENNRKYLDREWRELTAFGCMILVSCLNEVELQLADVYCKLGEK